MASIVMLEVPKGTEVGIDLNYWNCGPNFVGIKDIQKGTHFVYWSSVSQDDSSVKSCLRVGKFLVIQSVTEKILWKWDKQDETFVDCSETEKEAITTNWSDMLPRLGPVEQKNVKTWTYLSKYISKGIIDKVCPDNRPVCSATQLVPREYISTRSKRESSDNSESDHVCSSLAEAESRLPRMSESDSAKLCYSEVEKVQTEGMSAYQITASHLDHSVRLRHLLDQNYPTNNLYILGEIQFSFICFLIGQNYDSFEHWKKLVALICNSDSLILEMPKLFDIFLIVLHFQLQQIPSDFFVDILSANNFLVSVLHVLFTNVQSTHNVDEELQARCDKFRKYLTSKFGWDFMSEPTEWSPTIVQ
ncbi:protein AAR2 homolog [Convolutriloba macropyga]|uniref:protein AAR2 homolog n=1 Tax=Convolutriloba macropyga TaxID=536237 RepID=UPI003F525D1B